MGDERSLPKRERRRRRTTAQRLDMARAGALDSHRMRQQHHAATQRTLGRIVRQRIERHFVRVVVVAAAGTCQAGFLRQIGGRKTAGATRMGHGGHTLLGTTARQRGIGRRARRHEIDEEEEERYEPAGFHVRISVPIKRCKDRKNIRIRKKSAALFVVRTTATGPDGRTTAPERLASPRSGRSQGMGMRFPGMGFMRRMRCSCTWKVRLSMTAAKQSPPGVMTPQPDNRRVWRVWQVMR